MNDIEKYVYVWSEIQDLKKLQESLKLKVLKKLKSEAQYVQGYKVFRSERPNFAKVSLETARKYKAVRKTVNTTVLMQLLKQGEDIDGVTYTPYITISK